MILTFFNTGFDVTKNGVYENLQAYLATHKVQSYEYKHIDPALTITVKLPLSSHQFDKSAIGDYVEVDDDGTLYYYYVMNMKWKGKETLEVSLGLDTLNTFWKQISNSLTAETHITRRFKDRFNIVGMAAYSVVDPIAEEFNSVPMVRRQMTTVNPASSRKWNLVYLTEYTSSESLSDNPVNCYAIPSDSVQVPTGATGDVTWSASTFGLNIVYAMSEAFNAGDTFIIYNAAGSPLTYTIGDTYRGAFFVRSESDYVGVWVLNSSDDPVSLGSASKVTFTTCKQIYRQPWTRGEEGLHASAITNETPVAINAGESITVLTNFNTWYAANKTDGRLVKIRELPYAPFKETYKNNQLVIPSGWELSPLGLKFTGTTFGSYQLFYRHTLELPQLLKSDIEEGTSANIEYETKLYNSSYYTDKYVYDTNTWVQRLELNTNYDEGSEDLAINFKVSDGMDNGMVFYFESSQASETDFGEYMVIDKNTDKPYFTNEYLNYIRYGKYVDEKAVGFNRAATVASSLGSIASTVASTAFGIAAGFQGGGPVGAIIGGAVGIITAAVSIAKTVATDRDSINAKIDSYTHQASSVSGTSDVSLFNYYSGNKLLRVQYTPRDDIKQMLWRYFYLYGYACDEYAIPCFQNRHYVDYIKCEPVFSGDMIWNDFLDDIKQRMQLGYRVFHFVNNTYDLHLQYENWETTLWTWSHA